mmetsp:Transcript_1911/g.3344  ORF Transcript_1911/g.3344 Transcript_1911/m.3344 type:complete len:677 (+) Transcript_1911:373-2403(+)
MAHVLLVLSLLAAGANGYLVGIGKFDTTGPAADVNLMGYADPGQKAGGVWFRTYARAFVIGDDNGGNRVAFVSVDAGMVGHAVVDGVVKGLKRRGLPFSEENLCISATHTHSAPAGFLQHLLYQVTSFGFVSQSFDAMVNGIVQAVVLANNDAKAHRRILVGSGNVENANINRSPTAYNANPAGERAKYNSDTDSEMTVLKFEDSDGTPLGMLNWYSVHPTSMPKSNTLINGDNKGYASILFESYFPNFVAAFASTNLGDVSPNVRGAFCDDGTGRSCEDPNTSTCKSGGKEVFCVGKGPSDDPFQSCAIIGSRQAKTARDVFNQVNTTIDGPIRYAHTYRDMSNINVNGKRTCKAALGNSFTAGTTDGPGSDAFSEGDFLAVVGKFILSPSQEIQDCQAPKPVLIPTGEMSLPYDWTAKIMPLQIFLIGKQLAIISVPGEFTTMAGRRLREEVLKKLIDDNSLSPDGRVVIAGLSNEYSGYVTTLEEYNVQRYEGASTLYGPHTHQAYVQEFLALAGLFPQGATSSPGPKPGLISSKISLLTPVVFDSTGWFESFGDVLQQVHSSYQLGNNPVITCVFRTGNPRNNLRTNDSFTKVQYRDSNNNWVTIANDGTVDLRYIYSRSLSLSSAKIEWRPKDSLENIKPGTYRLVHQGQYKHWLWGVKSFTSTSKQFVLN